MVGIKLETLKQEVQKYLGIPYFQNKGKHKNSGDNVMVGKGTAREIALKTVECANKQKVKLLELSNQEIYNFQKKNHIGIDCSGLVYNLLQFINPLADKKLLGTDNKKGVRRLNADLLTSPSNATPIGNYDDIQTGDLIRLDHGRHVMSVVEKIKNLIILVHSSDKTKTRGVHYATIEITDPSKALNHQLWSDETKNGTNYSGLFDPSNGDGVFHPSILK